MPKEPLNYQERFDAIWKFEAYQSYAFEPPMMDRIVTLARKLGARRILSVGCGQGHGVKRLLDEGFDAYGVDVSPVALAHHPELKDRLLCADFTRVQTPLCGPIDLLYSVNTLPNIHPDDLDAFFRACKAQDPLHLYFLLSMGPDTFGKQLINQDLCPTVRHAHWWEHAVAEYFPVRRVNTTNERVLKVCSIEAHRGTVQPPSPTRSFSPSETPANRERCFKRNLQQLRMRNLAPADAEALQSPDADCAAANIKVFASPQGLPISAVQTQDTVIAFDHADDPLAEARNWARALKLSNPHSLVIMLGFGMGYAAEAVLRLAGPHTHLLVIEPYLPVLRAAMEHRDLRKLFSDARLHILPGMDDEQTIREINAIMISNYTFDASCLALRPVYAALLGEDALTFMETAAIRFDRNCRGRHVGSNMGLFWAQRNLQNTRWSIHLPGLEGLDGPEPIPAAVCVAAGPTLSDSYEFLRQMQDRIPILACDVAIGKLKEQGIVPHLASVLDASKECFEKTAQLDPLRTGLLLYNQVHPNFEDLPALLKVVILENSWNGLINKYVYPRRATCKWSFVGGMTVSAAAHIGIKRLYLVGMDFAFAPDGETHFSGSGLDAGKKHFHGEEWIKVKGNTVPELRTSHSLHTFLSQFNDFIHCNPDLELIPVTTGGAKIANLQHLLPQEALLQCEQFPKTDWRSRLAQRCEKARLAMDHDGLERCFRRQGQQFLHYHKLFAETDDHRRFLDILQEFMQSETIALTVNSLEQVFAQLAKSPEFTDEHVAAMRKRMDELSEDVRAMIRMEKLEAVAEPG